MAGSKIDNHCKKQQPNAQFNPAAFFRKKAGEEQNQQGDQTDYHVSAVIKYSKTSHTRTLLNFFTNHILMIAACKNYLFHYTQ